MKKLYTFTSLLCLCIVSLQGRELSTGHPSYEYKEEDPTYTYNHLE